MAALGKLDQRLVRFNTDGGSTIPDAMVTKGQMLTAPAEPTKAGFLFVGWFTDSNKTTAFDFETPINEDITLYAKWVRLGLKFSLANRLYTAVFDGENKSSIIVHYDADFSTLGVKDIAFSNLKSANQKINNLSFDLGKNQLTVNVTVGGTTADYTISLEVEPPQDKYYIVPQKGPVQSQIVAYDIKFYIVNDNESINFAAYDPTILETDYKKSVLVIDKSDTELQGKDIIVLAAGLNAEGKYVGSGKGTFNLDNDVRQLEIPFKRTPNSFELISDIREWYRQNVNTDDDLKFNTNLFIKDPTSVGLGEHIANISLYLIREYLAAHQVFSHIKYSPFYRGKIPAYGSISNGNLTFIYYENSYLPNDDWAIGVQNKKFYFNDGSAGVVVGEYEEGKDVVAKMVWR